MSLPATGSPNFFTLFKERLCMQPNGTRPKIQPGDVNRMNGHPPQQQVPARQDQGMAMMLQQQMLMASMPIAVHMSSLAQSMNMALAELARAHHANCQDGDYAQIEWYCHVRVEE
jgi:hypothetical protein